MLELAAGNQVLELAIRMEEAARDFYEDLAQTSSHPTVREFCALAAPEEAAHREIFQTILGEWTRSHEACPMAPGTLDALEMLVKQQTYPTRDEAERVARRGDMLAVVGMGLEMEYASIRYYEEMRYHLPHLAETLDRILAEERGHVDRLMALAEVAARRRM